MRLVPTVFALVVPAIMLGAAPRSAQVPSPDAPRPMGAKSAAAPLSVSGCIERPMTAGAPATFKLTNVQPATKDQAASAAQANRPGSTVMPSASPADRDSEDMLAEAYWLQAPASIDLAAHVNHKVEVTGTVDSKIMTSTPKVTGAKSDAPTFKVTSLRMVASTCK